MGVDGWRSLLAGVRGPHADIAAEAWPVFLRDYDLSDADEVGIPRGAAQAYMAALRAGRVPQWIQDMALGPEISRAARR